MPDPRTIVDTHRNGTIPSMLQTIRTRVADGAVIRLDGKAACPGGPFGDDEAYSKDTVFDPGWCFRNRDRNLPPVMRVGVPCNPAGLAMLFWPDLYSQAQVALRELLANKPPPGSAWDTRFLWTRTVLTLVSIALEATNVQPMFMFPAKWAEQVPYTAICAAGNPGCTVPGSRINWGLYSSCYTLDGAVSQTDPGGYLCYGGAVPREVLQRFLSLAALPTNMLCTVGVNQVPLAGVHFNRDQAAPPSIGAAMPARMVGSCIFDRSQLVRSLADHDHDPWRNRGNSAQGTKLSATGPIPTYVWGRLATESGQSIPQIYASTFQGKSCEMLMQWIFEMETSAVVARAPGAPPPTALVPGSAYLVAGADADGVGRQAPGPRLYLELAAAWGETILNRTYIDILASSTFFYLTNHATYFRRIFGDSFAMTLEQQRDLLAATQRMKSQLLSAPASGIAAALAPVTGGLFSQIAQNVINGVTELMTTYGGAPELPKPLYRRVPTDLTCGFDTSAGGDAATSAAARELQRQLEESRRHTAQQASPVPAIAAGVAALGLGVGLMYLILGRK